MARVVSIFEIAKKSITPCLTSLPFLSPHVPPLPPPLRISLTFLLLLFLLLLFLLSPYSSLPEPPTSSPLLPLVPQADLVFRGMFDSIYNVGSVLEKKLQPLPFTFMLSAFLGHSNPAYRFGFGLMVG